MPVQESKDLETKEKGLEVDLETKDLETKEQVGDLEAKEKDLEVDLETKDLETKEQVGDLETKDLETKEQGLAGTKVLELVARRTHNSSKSCSSYYKLLVLVQIRCQEYIDL